IKNKRMNKYINQYIIGLSVAVVMLSACSKDLLETLPNDRLSEDIYWKTENDAKLAVNSLYTFLDGVSVLSWDAATEIAHSNQLANSLTFIELGTYDIANA